jgi:glutamate-5-semialdehyde dehydrogenase
MNRTLSTEQRNKVLATMAGLLKIEKKRVLSANELDMDSFDRDDLAMYDRLKVDADKIEGMILSLNQLARQHDPLGKERYSFVHDNGLRISNRTAPFGTVMIIYESRPDVTVEAAGIAFKSGNRILLKGGRESLNSNQAIVDLWHLALEENDLQPDWVRYLNLSREKTREFFKNPAEKIDLIIPRGGENLIRFVKEYARCPVIVSGRGNNFAYVHKHANPAQAIDILLNAKTDKISACNALDKVLIDRDLPGLDDFVVELIDQLRKNEVEVILDSDIKRVPGTFVIEDERVWYEEFLDYRILIGLVASEGEAIQMINKYSGGHSASIITEEDEAAREFMDQIDSAAVFHNASTRFTDGFQFGLGGELAISTDKLHQRGPLGLQHLVTNKWYVYGSGQTR